MELAYLAVALTIIGGGEPEVEMIPQNIYTDQAQCLSWRADMESLTPRTTHADGRPVISRQFVCQLVSLEDLESMIAAARTK